MALSKILLAFDCSFYTGDAYIFIQYQIRVLHLQNRTWTYTSVDKTIKRPRAFALCLLICEIGISWYIKHTHAVHICSVIFGNGRELDYISNDKKFYILR